MPRRRSAGPPQVASASSADASGATPSRVTRLTRSSSARNLLAERSSPDVLSNSVEVPRTTRGRPRKDSLLPSAQNSPAPSISSIPATKFPLKRRGGRPSSALAISSESVSSVPTPLDGSSESDYTTPGTSKMPTPSAADISEKHTSIQVQIPVTSSTGRALTWRSTPRGLKREISDSEEEDFSDNSPGAKLARRLQAEEDSKHFAPTGNRRSSPRDSKQGAASRGPEPATIGPSRRPAKKAKIEPVTENKGKAKIDIDAEIAAQGLHFHVSLPDDYTEPEIDLSDDDVPLKKSRRRKGKGKAKIDIDAEIAAQGSHFHVSLPDDYTESEIDTDPSSAVSETFSESELRHELSEMRTMASERRAFRRSGNSHRLKMERNRLIANHPEVETMWDTLENMPVLKAGKAIQPTTISRQLKPFQLEGLAWMMAMEKMEWKGGLLGDEMGLGKTIQAVSLIMSDYPAKQPSLVLVPPVALMQWQSEIESYTDGTLKTFVYHGTNQKTKGMSVKDLKKYDVIMMSYNSLESIYRKQEKGFKRKDGIYKEKSIIHSINFHRVILDEAHCIKTRTTMTAKACFALKADFRWCLTGTPLQNRIGEFFSLLRFLNVRPFASYLCKQCPCSTLEWTMNEDSRCSHCKHAGMQHVSVFNQELLNPIQKFGNLGPGREAFRKLRLMTERIMLRRLKKDHTNSMELPVKEIYVDRQFFGEAENDFANSIMTNGQRKFDTYVAQGVLLNNYANIFGLIMQMRQVADHPDLLLRKHAEGGQNVLVCCICDEPAEDSIRSRCKHGFCRACVGSYVRSTDEPDCPRCHIPLSIDLEQPEIEQDETLMKKSSIINRIKMENWTSSSKIELLVHELHKLRSNNASHKSIIFSQFTTMLQLIEWRLRRAGITTVMLDGSMTPAQRQASIEHFMTNVNVECFLVSLKAGGVALNLTEASRVFIVDPWWNPAAEWQSADRCHRIGQARPCTITRLCIEDSVESRMVLIQEKKTNMINSTVNADDKAMESLSPQDMQFLFRGS